jgi:LPS-assembly protein
LLPDDRVANSNRWAGQWQQRGELPSDTHYDWQWRRVSDDDYWKDFSNRMPSPMPRLLQSDARVQRHWHHDFGQTTAYAAVRGWQVLQDTDPTALIDPPYRREPQMGLRQRGDAAGWQWDWQTEFNRFVHEDPSRQRGDRAHLLASVAYPLGERGWTLTPKVSLNAASYQVEQPLRLNPGDLSGPRSASRVIPTASLDSSWVFERPTRLFDRDVTQTLEPRLLYVNTPYQRQDYLPNFDSAPNDFNITSVYAENLFSGVDRVSDANQFTAGITTRFLDAASGVEALRLGIVQRYLFRDQAVTPGDGEPFRRRFSDLLLIGSTSLVPKWNFDATIQYSPEIDRSIRSIVSARFSPGPFRTVSTTYRFTRELSEQVELGWQWPLYGPGPAVRPPLRSPPPDVDEPAPTLLSRASSGSGGSCQGTWYSVGRINYSLKDRRYTDSLVGFEYDAGCWIGRIVATRLSTGREEATTRLSFQLELVGLSRLNLGSNPLQTLKDNIPGYQLLRDDGR